LNIRGLIRFALLSALTLAVPAVAGPGNDTRVPMTNERVAQLLGRLDLDATGGNGLWSFDLAGRDVTIVTHEAADRMRIFTAVAAADALDEESLRRVLQANFDSALDARYAIAKGVLWSVFIHPLAALDDAELLAGLGQVVNLANTFGGDYTSGLLLFGGGDSGGIRERELIDQLIEKGLAI